MVLDVCHQLLSLQMSSLRHCDSPFIYSIEYTMQQLLGSTRGNSTHAKVSKKSREIDLEIAKIVGSHLHTPVVLAY